MVLLDVQAEAGCKGEEGVVNIAHYWEQRYKNGGTSGDGSRGAEALAKANMLQEVVHRFDVEHLLDLGCGDGEVASLVDVKHYTGYDLSASALKRAQHLMPHRRFINEIPNDEVFDLVVSMDVMHHLVNEEDYRRYMELLFSDLAPRVFVYGTNHRQQGRAHVLHRHWRPDVPAGWQVEELSSRFKRAWLISRA